jgi:hypothetical protein
MSDVKNERIQQLSEELQSSIRSVDGAPFIELENKLRRCQKDIDQEVVDEETHLEFRRAIAGHLFRGAIRRDCSYHITKKQFEYLISLKFKHISEKYTAVAIFAQLCVHVGKKAEAIQLFRGLREELLAIEIRDSFMKDDLKNIKVFIARIESDSLPPF